MTSILQILNKEMNLLAYQQHGRSWIRPPNSAFSRLPAPEGCLLTIFVAVTMWLQKLTHVSPRTAHWFSVNHERGWHFSKTYSFVLTDHNTCLALIWDFPVQRTASPFPAKDTTWWAIVFNDTSALMLLAGKLTWEHTSVEMLVLHKQHPS